MTKSWHAHARHILDTIEKIRRIESRGSLVDDDILYDAALRNLQTMSESSQCLPDRVKALYPQIPWREISGFRNILVHNYLGNIDPLTVQRVVERHLVPLEQAKSDMLESGSGQEG